MRAARRVWLVLLLVLVGGLIGTSITRAAKPPPPPPSCTLVPQLRDVTVNQGIGAYSPLVNGKETLVRFYLSMPSCAGSGAMIQIKEGTTLTVSGGGSPATVELTPVPLSTAYPAIASFSAAPMTDSTGDPKFIVPASTVTSATAFTAGFSALIRFQSQPTRTSPFTSGQVTFSTRPGTTTPIQASFDKPSNALGVLFVPMGDATKTYSTQWTTNGQQALQDGMTAAVARQYPLPAGVGNLGGTGGLRYTVAPTLLDLTRVGPTGLNLLIPPQTPVATKFCGTGANYDLIKAELGQFLLAHNTVNTNAKANRVVGVVDPAVGLGPPDPCFEGMAVVNSQEAWALARPGRAGQLIGLELAHTLGLTPPPRESPFDGAHSQNIPAENPSANRRYNLVQRSFITTDRSLMKPSGTNPSPDNINTLLEVPDFAFLLCVFGGTLIPECQNYGPGTVSATAPVAASLSFVMSGTTTGEAGIPPASTGTATGTSVFESYFASSIGQTTPSTNSLYRLVQRASAGGTVLSNQGVPVTFLHSEHGTGSASSTHSSGLFSLALPFLTTTNRVELWKGAPDASGSLLLYATDRTQAPVLSSFSVGGGGIGYRLPARASAPTVTQAVETLQAEASTDLVVNDAGDEPDAYPDGVCDSDLGTDGNQCTLRAAIEVSNATAGADMITFDLPEGDTQIALVGSALPSITSPVVIDGTSQPAGTVSLNGDGAGTANGLVLAAGSGGSTIEGLEIRDFFSGSAIRIESANNTVVDNTLWAVGDGIVVAGEGASGNQIGGSAEAGEGNRIWDFNSYGVLVDTAGGGNEIAGNTIGLDEADAPSGGDVGVGVFGTPNTVIGDDVGPSDLFILDFDRGNVIVDASGEGGYGIYISGTSTDTVVAGNFIGVNRTGSATNLGNDNAGIRVAASGNQLGPGNTVAYNGSSASGIRVSSGTGNRIVANSIHDNIGDGIVLSGEGANNNLAEPDLHSASLSGGTTTVQGQLDGVPFGTYFVEFFSNPPLSCDVSGFGEGKTYLDFATVVVDTEFESFSKTLAGLALGDIVTATLTSAPGDDTSEFSNCVTVENALPAGQESWDAAATDDFPLSLVLDGFLDCGPGKPVWSIFNAKKPDSTSATTAFWSGTFDSSLAPAGCTLKVKPNDGFTQPGFTLLGEETVNDGPNSLVAAISSPPHVTPVATFLQYSLIPLRGLVMNPDGVLPGSAYDWTLTGPGINRSGANTFRDEQPPSGGWPTPGGAATYTATLSSQVGTTSATDTVTFTIKADADNDGIARDVESLPCFGSPPAGVAHNDNNPLNADDDSDGDGIPNASDPQPCTPASSYTALIEFNPDPFPTPSNGNTVTVYVRVPGRNVGQVLSNTVRISRIADQDIAPADFFKNIAWSVSGGVGTAKFDRQKLIAWLAARNIDDQTITVTVVGNAGAPAWSFEGSDTVFITD